MSPWRVCSKGTLDLDDWVIERFSDKAPACRTHHQHSKKRNRYLYLGTMLGVFGCGI